MPMAVGIFMVNYGLKYGFIPGLVNVNKKLWKDPPLKKWLDRLFRLGHFLCRKLLVITRPGNLPRVNPLWLGNRFFFCPNGLNPPLRNRWRFCFREPRKITSKLWTLKMRLPRFSTSPSFQSFHLSGFCGFCCKLRPRTVASGSSPVGPITGLFYLQQISLPK